MRVSKDKVPDNATVRELMVDCGKPGCSTPHGPYLYYEWRVGGKVMTAYGGKKPKARNKTTDSDV